MAKKKHDSIYKLYPSVVRTKTTDGINYQAFDKDGKSVSINKAEPSMDPIESNIGPILNPAIKK